MLNRQLMDLLRAFGAGLRIMKKFAAIDGDKEARACSFLRLFAPFRGLFLRSGWGRGSLLPMLFLAAFACRCAGSGVTIITHGYSGDVNGWITGMADAIPSYAALSRSNFTTYKLTLTTDGNGNYFYQTSRTNGVAPFVSTSGEIFVKLDWSQMAGGVTTGNYDLSTYDVAWAASQVLLMTNAIAELGGHALVEFPLHLVGHSRGGSLMAELSRLLGTNGLWIDHLTTLDPHPLNNDGNTDPVLVTDASANHVYANVLFSDNYWQDLSGAFYDPSGEAVSGAYNRQLTTLPGGYNNTSSLSPYHSNVHLWYHGTISLVTPTSDTEASLSSSERQAWWTGFEQQGTNAGFEYSLLGAGNRQSTSQPVGPGFPSIVDGYNQWWDLGAGTSNNRTPLAANSGQWPSLIKINLTSTNVVPAGTALAARLYYQYGGSFSNAALQVFLDPDSNPFNSNETRVLQTVLTNSGVGSVYAINTNLDTSTVTAGTYRMYASISDGTHSRYVYAPEIVQVLPPSQPPLLDIQGSAGTALRIGITGAPGATVVLQNSTDLHNWVAAATNTLTSGRWVYTNSSPASNAALFYRAMLRH